MLLSLRLSSCHLFVVCAFAFAIVALVVVVVVVLVVVVTSDVEAAFGIFGDDSSGEEGVALSIVLVLVLFFLRPLVFVSCLGLGLGFLVSGFLFSCLLSCLSPWVIGLGLELGIDSPLSCPLSYFSCLMSLILPRIRILPLVRF
jgi:hypothetical protein